MGEQGALEVLAIPNGRELILTVTEYAQALCKAYSLTIGAYTAPFSASTALPPRGLSASAGVCVLTLLFAQSLTARAPPRAHLTRGADWAQ